MEIIENDTVRRLQLLDLSNWLKIKLKTMGFDIPNTKTPIIPIIVGAEDKTVEFSKRLLQECIYIPAIRPPSVPKGTSRLRISLMATHSKEDLNEVLIKLESIGKELNIIGGYHA